MSEIDFNSDTWRATVAWAKGEIERHRNYLEDTELPKRQTHLSRGAIQQLRALLHLGKPSKIPAMESSEP